MTDFYIPYGEVHIAIDEGLAKECGVITKPSTIITGSIEGDIFKWEIPDSDPDKIWRRFVAYHDGIFKILRIADAGMQITFQILEMCDPDFIEKVKQWIERDIKAFADYQRNKHLVVR